MTRIGIVIGSTRPGRRADTVAQWVYTHASRRTDAEFELVDIADFHLPLLDEPLPAGFVAMGRGEYVRPHTKAWSAKVASFDGFVFVAGEYNHAAPAALKNAIDYLSAEWQNKAAGFVSYGGEGRGIRSVENLRLIMAELCVADVRIQVALSAYTDWENFTTFKPDSHQLDNLTKMLDQVVAWSNALAPLRVPPRRQLGDSTRVDEPAAPSR